LIEEDNQYFHAKKVHIVRGTVTTINHQLSEAKESFPDSSTRISWVEKKF
jgi:hypothetical protein